MLFSGLNEKIKKLSVMDIGLVKLSALFFGILIVKMFPVLLNIGYPTLIIIILLCGIKPLYVFWVKK